MSNVKKLVKAGSTPNASEGKSAEVLAAEALAGTQAEANTDKTFPRDMLLVNDTAQNWVVRAQHVFGSTSIPIHVRDEDDLKRIHTDCHYILSVSDHYKPVAPVDGEEAKPHALRVVEIDTDIEA